MYRDDKDKLMQLSKFQGQPKKEILLLETKKIADVSPDMVQTFSQSKKKGTPPIKCKQFRMRISEGVEIL